MILTDNSYRLTTSSTHTDPRGAKSEERELTNQNIVKVLSEHSTPRQMAFSQVLVTMKLLLVMPARNACSERSFSSL